MPSPDVLLKLAELVQLPLSPERAVAIAPPYSDLKKLIDQLEDAEVDATEPAMTFGQTL